MADANTPTNAHPTDIPALGDRRGNEGASIRGQEQLSLRPTTSTIRQLFTSLFFAKGKAMAPVDAVLSSETTPLLDPLGFRVEGQELRARNGSSLFWDEIKTLVKFALPVFGSYVLEYSITVSSVISIGHISTIALAAVTIGFMTANVSGFSIILGMSSALDTVLPSAWTSDNPRLVGLWTQRMVVLQFIALVPIYAIWLNGESLLLALRQDPEVAKYAGIYLKWAFLSLPAYSFNSISRRYFQAQGLFDVPARIIIFVAPINIFLNYLFVWGPDSIRLGFIGAPIAIAISYNLISIASIIYGVFFVERTAWHPLTSQCLTSLGSLMKLSLGSVGTYLMSIFHHQFAYLSAGQVVSEWWSWELVGLAASLLGPTALASQSVLLTTISCTFQAPFALGAAASVRIGNLLGEKDAIRAGVAANAAVFLSLLLALFLGTILLTFRATWGYIFNNDPVVVALVASVLPLVAFVQIFDSCNAVICGILRARGKQALGAMINIGAYYCLGFPIGLWLTFKHHWDLLGLWWGLTIAMAWVVFLDVYLCWTTDWQEEVERVMARLAVDKAYQQEGGDEERAH